MFGDMSADVLLLIPSVNLYFLPPILPLCSIYISYMREVKSGLNSALTHVKKKGWASLRTNFKV